MLTKHAKVYAIVTTYYNLGQLNLGRPARPDGPVGPGFPGQVFIRSRPRRPIDLEILGRANVPMGILNPFPS